MYFLADENYPFDAMCRLREVGHDVVAIVRDSSGASDEEVLERAAREGRVVLTFDHDYGRLLYEEPLEGSLVPVGIVYFRFDPSPPEEPTRLLFALLEQSGFSLTGRITFVERDRVRQRPLPEAR